MSRVGAAEDIDGVGIGGHGRTGAALRAEEVDDSGRAGKILAVIEIIAEGDDSGGLTGLIRRSGGRSQNGHYEGGGGGVEGHIFAAGFDALLARAVEDEGALGCDDQTGIGVNEGEIAFDAKK